MHKQHKSKTTVTRSGTSQRANVKHSYSKPPKGATGGAANPKRTSTTYTPSSEDSSVTTESESSSRGGKSLSDSFTLPTMGGSAQMVLVLGVGLYMLATWQSVFVPFTQLMWTGKHQTIDYKSSLGMLILLAVMVTISTFNEDVAGLMLISVIGMWIVYITMSGNGSAGNNLTKFLSWLSNPASNKGQAAKPGTNSTTTTQQTQDGPTVTL